MNFKVGQRWKPETGGRFLTIIGIDHHMIRYIWSDYETDGRACMVADMEAWVRQCGCRTLSNPNKIWKELNEA